jgi:hypothetical protein
MVNYNEAFSLNFLNELMLDSISNHAIQGKNKYIRALYRGTD